MRAVTIASALCACFVAGEIAAQEAPPLAAGASSAPVEEIVILGERPGPRLWKITRGDHTLWLLGLLQPLPRRMQWKSAPVEEVLDQAQEVIEEGVAVGARVGLISGIKLYRQWRSLQGNPGDKTLAEVLPAPLYARFAALRAKYAPRDRSLDELRPMLAAQRLFAAAVERIGLTTENDVHERVIKLAKKRDLEIRRVKMILDDPAKTLASFDRIPQDQEIACFETTLARLESDVGAMGERARAWADGDIEAYRAVPYADQQVACWQALASAPELKPLIERARAEWLGFVDAALANSRVSLAMDSLDRILAPDGTLARLRAKGYEVRGPE